MPMLTARFPAVAVTALLYGCPPPDNGPVYAPTSFGGMDSEDSSSSSGGCKKGCRCGNSCIDCSKTCRNGDTYRKRKRR